MSIKPNDDKFEKLDLRSQVAMANNMALETTTVNTSDKNDPISVINNSVPTMEDKNSKSTKKNETEVTTTVVSNENSTITLKVNVENRNNNDELYKKYFVRLPHSKYEFNVRGLLVEEEYRIKNDYGIPKKSIETFNHIFYDCISDDIKNLPNHPFNTYESFIRSISQVDRDVIALAIIEQTYESIHDMAVVCNNCREQFTTQVNLSECMNIKYYPGEPGQLIQKRKVIEIPELEWTVYLKVPTLFDELKLVNMNTNTPIMQKAIEYGYIDKIEYVDNTTVGKKKSSTSNVIEIYSLISKKPAIIRKRILKEMSDLIGDYGVTTRFDTKCEYCGSPITVNINPINHFLFLVQ